MGKVDALVTGFLGGLVDRSLDVLDRVLLLGNHDEGGSAAADVREFVQNPMRLGGQVPRGMRVEDATDQPPTHSSGKEDQQRSQANQFKANCNILHTPQDKTRSWTR